MPPCKNDSNRTYVGNEPSPKGNGYCAHAEKLYSMKEGLDYNKWIVVPSDKSPLCRKKWVPFRIPSSFFNNFKKNESNG